MRWSEFDSSIRSALAFVIALAVMAAIAAGLSWQLQERWPLVVFFVAFFGVVLFLASMSAWQHLTEPREPDLNYFKRATLFQVPFGQPAVRTSGWSAARAICFVLLLAALAAFFIHSLAIGGDALRGYENGGHYFVRLHNRVTEVSSLAWHWNWRLGVGLFILLPLTFVVTFVAAYKERHDRFHYRDLDVH